MSRAHRSLIAKTDKRTKAEVCDEAAERELRLLLRKYENSKYDK